MAATLRNAEWNEMFSSPADAFSAQIRSFALFLDRAESPVERAILYILFTQYPHAFIRAEADRGYYLTTPFTGNGPWNDLLFTLEIEPQATIEVATNSLSGEETKRYRADMLVTLTRYRLDEGDWGIYGKLIVEIDGHDFHERTKEQASRDRQRDREFLLAGYRTLRFTGSDVFRDPWKCAGDIHEHIAAEADRVYEMYRAQDRIVDLVKGKGPILT